MKNPVLGLEAPALWFLLVQVVLKLISVIRSNQTSQIPVSHLFHADEQELRLGQLTAS